MLTRQVVPAVEAPRQPLVTRSQDAQPAAIDQQAPGVKGHGAEWRARRDLQRLERATAFVMAHGEDLDLE